MELDENVEREICEIETLMKMGREFLFQFDQIVVNEIENLPSLASSIFPVSFPHFSNF